MSLSMISQELLMSYSRLEYLLLGDLRSILAEPGEVRDNRWLLAILDSLLETIPREYAICEADGYLSELVERQPNLASAAETLKRERQRIFEMLADLRSRIGTSLDATSLADQLHVELRDWMAKVMKHHRRERRMYYAAFNTDVGECD